jgi:hypothetical protein
MPINKPVKPKPPVPGRPKPKPPTKPKSSKSMTTAQQNSILKKSKFTSVGATKRKTSCTTKNVLAGGKMKNVLSGGKMTTIKQTSGFMAGKPKPKPTPKKTVKPTPKPKGPRKMPSEAELRKGYLESAAGKRGGYSYGDYILTVRKAYGYKNQMDYPKR